jgi:CheY-like chemotaxis protein
LPPESSDIPAIALSPVADPEDKSRSLQAGYRAHITKPIVVPDLVSILVPLADEKRPKKQRCE